MLSDKITIRTAEPKDAALIAALGTTTFYEAYYEQDEPFDLADYIVNNFNLPQIQSEFEDSNSTFFIAYLQGKAVGFAKLRENSHVECMAGKNAVELQRIYALQAVWGKGVGEVLLNHCLKTAKDRGFQSLWLSVWTENVRAQRFYEKQGFEKVGTTSFYYGSEYATNLVLEKEL